MVPPDWHHHHRSSSPSHVQWPEKGGRGLCIPRAIDSKCVTSVSDQGNAFPAL